MKIEFTGTYKNKIVEKESLYLNTISIKRNDGKIVIIDRNETDYTIENGIIDILFRGIYEWDHETAIYPNRGIYEWDCETAIYPNNKDTDLYNNALIVGYEIEDDAPSGYDLIIEKQKISAW